MLIAHVANFSLAQDDAPGPFDPPAKANVTDGGIKDDSEVAEDVFDDMKGANAKVFSSVLLPIPEHSVRSLRAIKVTEKKLPKYPVYTKPRQVGDWKLTRLLVPVGDILPKLFWEDNSLCLIGQVGSLTKISLNGDVKQRIELDCDIADAGWSRLGLVLLDDNANELLLFDMASKQVKSIAPAPGDATLLCSRNSSLVFLTAGDAPWQAVYVFDLAGNRYLTSQDLMAEEDGEGADVVAISDDGRAIIGANRSQLVVNRVQGSGDLQLVASRSLTETLEPLGLAVSKQGEVCLLFDQPRGSMPELSVQSWSAPKLNSTGPAQQVNGSIHWLGHGPNDEWLAMDNAGGIWGPVNGKVGEIFYLPGIPSSTRTLAFSPQGAVAALTDSAVFLGKKE
ncbi:MAG: hypothetical protein AAF483_15755 [Planctomycetota bacterium]